MVALDESKQVACARCAAETYARDVRPRLRQSQFYYIDLSRSQLLYGMAAGDGFVFVIGLPDEGAYEWLYFDAQRGTLQWSDQGWGGCDCAMREALQVATL